MNMRWRKVGTDFRAYRLQIGLIGLVLVLGAAGVIAALNAKAILERAIGASFESSNPPDLVLWFDKIDSELLAVVAAQPGVAAVDARRVTFSRIAAADGTWLPLRVTILGDVAQLAQSSNAQHSTQSPQQSPQQSPHSSLARPHFHGESAVIGDGIWIEQSGVDLLPGHGTEPLRIRTPGGGIATLPMAGPIHDPGVAPSTQERVIYAFVTPATAALLGQGADPDQLLVKMTQRVGASDAIELGSELSAWARTRQRPALRIDVLATTHPHAGLMNALLRVLGVLAAIAFTSSAALAAFMVSLWMKREVRVVGIMKTIGARSHQIAVQYLALVGPLVVIATAIALPLGNLLGHALVHYYAGSLNVDVIDWRVPVSLQSTELLLAFCIPLLAMAAPIVRAVRITARAAISDDGIIAPRVRPRMSRWLLVPGDRRWTLALRNSFRRPWRLTLIVLALASGGALLLTTHSNYESLMRVIDRSLAQQGHDIEIIMQRPAPAAQLEAIARSVTDVERAEAWHRTGASIDESGGASNSMHAGSEGKRFALIAFPRGSTLFQLPILEGRAPGDDAADEVLMTRTMREAYPDLAVGRDVDVRYRDRSARVHVVGLVEEIGQPALYTNFATYEALTGVGDAATAIRIKAGNVALAPLAAALDQALLDAHLTPSQIVTRDLIRDSLDEHFKVVGDVIRMVALTASLVGAIVLAASTSLNVLERTREIGVLRALGAAPATIAAIFFAEGVTVALFSAVLAIALSIALTLALNSAAARTLLHVAVPLHFSLTGLAILSGGALVVFGAVGLSVLRVFRLSAREALAYE